MEMEEYEIKLSTKQMSLIFRNLFNGDKNLGESSALIIGIISSHAYLRGAKFT